MMINSSGLKKVLWTAAWFMILAFLVTACTPTGLRLPEAPMLAALERKSGLVVYVGADGNIYTIDQGGGRNTAVTSDAQIEPDEQGNAIFYQFPSWSPDASKIAFIRVIGSFNTIDEVSLYTVDPDGSNLLKTYSSPDAFPFYIYWSPDSQMISFLTTPFVGDGVSLTLVPAAGGEAHTLATSGSVYWSWSPDNRNIIVHSGGAARNQPEARMALLDIEAEFGEEELDLKPVSFQAPAWSPNGSEMLLAAETEDGEDALFLTDHQGQVKKVLAKIAGSVAFGWSRDGSHLAYISREAAGPDSPQKLTVLDPEKPDAAVTLEEENVVAFFWSPNSRKLAFFVPQVVLPEEGSGGGASPGVLLQVFIYDIRSGKTIEAATFQPTSQFINLLPFFDQYQHSVSLWSPDSRYLLVSALDADGEEGIYVLEAAANLQPRYLAAGAMGYWSWK